MNDLHKLFWDSFAGVSTQSYPPYNIYKKNENYILEFGAAGFTKDELAIEYDGRALVVSGTRDHENDPEDVQYVHRSLAKRNFKQTIAVRGQFDIGEVFLANGILTIEMKDKTERVRPKIEVRDIPLLK